MAHNGCVVVVPMYNEAAAVASVVAGLRQHFDRVLCVDDGSNDDSASVARGAGATVLRHVANLGQGAALQTGFDYVLSRTTAEHVVTFDADGQHCVDDAVAMLKHAETNAFDVVLGSRSLGGVDGQPLARRLVLALAVRYSRASSGLTLTDTHNGLRVLSRRAVACMNLRHRGMAYATELESRIVDHRLRWTEHPVTIRYTDHSRAKGQSNLNAFNILYDLATARLSAAR